MSSSASIGRSGGGRDDERGFGGFGVEGGGARTIPEVDDDGGGVFYGGDECDYDDRPASAMRSDGGGGGRRGRTRRSSRSRSRRRLPLAAFWTSGLLNNAGYVIMLASAKSISEGGTAMVFLANVMPSLLVKLTAPYWFDRAGYRARMAAAALLMASSFVVVGYFSGFSPEEEEAGGGSGDGRRHSVVVGMELVGVALGSLQGGLGEASLLALAGRFDSLHIAHDGQRHGTGGGVRGDSDGDGEAEGDDEGGGGGGGESKKSNSGGSGRCITAFSSGTGLAGVFGFAYKVVLTDWLGFSLGWALFVANGLAAMYWLTFRRYLDVGGGAVAEAEDVSAASADRRRRGLAPSREDVPAGSERGVELHLLQDEDDGVEENPDGRGDGYSDGDGEGKISGVDILARMKRWGRVGRSYDGLGTSELEEAVGTLGGGGVTPFESAEAVTEDWANEDGCDGGATAGRRSSIADVGSLSTCGRLRLTLSLWPYMVPLFTVYAAEYALQSGTWTAIGFPVDSVDARDEFYEYSNWMYQAGVFLSRSSGTLFTATLPFLWLMPLLQCVNLAFFYYVAATRSSFLFGYDYTLLVPCFYTGLLGGAVYVNAYNRITADLPTVSMREFALSAASVADSFGIVAADISGLFIQSCLYAKNGIDGAVVPCPLGGP